MTTKIWDKESIQHLIKTNDLALAKAIRALYARQTDSEKVGEHTNTLNGVGFNKLDAPFLTSIAKALPHYNMHMTPRQIAKARPKMMKYWRQLVEIANENEARKSPTVDPAVANQQTRQTRQDPNFARF